MKKLNFHSLLFILGLALVSFLSSCGSDPCKDDPCGLNGDCVAVGDDFDCVCDAGYEGATCELISRDKFVGQYVATENCSVGNYPVTVSAVTTDPNNIQPIRLQNLGGYTCPNEYFINGTVSGNTVTINSQSFCNNTYTISGSGTISGNTLTITYTTTYGTTIDNCTATLVR